MRVLHQKALLFPSKLKEMERILLSPTLNRSSWRRATGCVYVVVVVGGGGGGELSFIPSHPYIISLLCQASSLLDCELGKMLISILLTIAQ